jgi:uncharacterized protein (DUF1501 family)
MKEAGMGRRDFLKGMACGLAGLGGLTGLWPQPAFAAAEYRRLLILIELKGGNDGLNTVVPYADPTYAQLRPRLALARDSLVQLDARTALHPALAALLPLWQQKECSIVQSVGYPRPNLSHFRSIEIWDTASDSDETLSDGWLARTFRQFPPPRQFAADGVLIGGHESGPLLGARAIALSKPEQFRRQARLAQTHAPSANPALQHVLKVERDIRQAAEGLGQGAELRTPFPDGPFGQAVSAACQVVAAAPVAVLQLSLGSFDTHQRQRETQHALLQQLANGVLALRAGLQELGRWQDTLVMTYSEFGRRPRENQSGGTDHGTAAPHFLFGPGLRGGLYGQAPDLNHLDGDGNLGFAVDFRQLYASVLEGWWQLPSRDILGAKFNTLPLWRG